MSLRIVSGVLFISGGNGSVTIELKSNTIVGGTGNASIGYPCTYGGDTHYDVEPCSALSIRAFNGNPDSVNINGPSYSGPTTGYENVSISWSRSGVGAELTEITYFFAGEE